MSARVHPPVELRAVRESAGFLDRQRIHVGAQAEFAAGVADGIVGAANVVRNADPTLGAEDFSFMLRARPGAYLFIGNGDGVHRDAGHGAGPCTLHNASYDFNDELIPIGGTFWIRLAEQFLQQA